MTNLPTHNPVSDERRTRTTMTYHEEDPSEVSQDLASSSSGGPWKGSDGESGEHANNKEEQNVYGVKGNKGVLWGKVATIATILLTAAAVSVATYSFLENRNTLEFQSDVSSTKVVISIPHTCNVLSPPVNCSTEFKRRRSKTASSTSWVTWRWGCVT